MVCGNSDSYTGEIKKMTEKYLKIVRLGLPKADRVSPSTYIFSSENYSWSFDDEYINITPHITTPVKSMVYNTSHRTVIGVPKYRFPLAHCIIIEYSAIEEFNPRER